MITVIIIIIVINNNNNNSNNNNNCNNYILLHNSNVVSQVCELGIDTPEGSGPEECDDSQLSRYMYSICISADEVK